MSEILTVALHAEGTTDHRFFKPIIQRTLEDIILNSDYDIELYSIVDIYKETGNNYCNEIIRASKIAYNSGIKCLIIHCDADADNVKNVMQHKITPACSAIEENTNGDTLCKNIIPLIPIYMTEAWMLSDIELLKSEICAEKIDNATLGLNKHPQSYSNPKEVIRNSITISQSNRTKHRRTFDISELYSPLGQKIDLVKLKQLTSFQNFYDELKKIALPYC